jgi:hypothetical protein
MKAVFQVVLFCLLSVAAIAQSGPPALCKPCLFYGGDFSNDLNSYALWDENTLFYPNTSTYGAVRVPKGHSVVVEGILFQIQFDPSFLLDPRGVTWEIRKGVTAGSGGTVIASGQGPVAVQPTGRFDIGPEYTVAIKTGGDVPLTGGTYWFNITPVCVNQRDSACETIQYGVSNTTQQANSFRGGLQPVDEMFINSQYYNYNWANVCSLNINHAGCATLSFGLMGRIIQ